MDPYTQNQQPPQTAPSGEFSYQPLKPEQGAPEMHQYPPPPAYAQGQQRTDPGTQFPGYYPASANLPAQQQSSNNVVVIGQQPAPVQSAVFVRQPVDPAVHSANTIQLVLAIVVFGISFFCGCWHSFVFLIPAIIFSAVGMDHVNGKKFSYAALGFNIAAIVTNVLTVVAVAIYIGVAVSIAKQEVRHSQDFFDNYN